VSKQLAAGSSSGKGSTIDQQFAALESGSAVDDELAAMKASQVRLWPIASSPSLVP
jgi:phage shock protein A